MKRLAMVAAAVACSAQGAIAQAPSEQILGTWTCEQAGDDLTVRQTITFLPGGQSRIDQWHGEGGPAGNRFELSGSAAGVWEIIQDLMQQKITSNTLSSTTLNGQPMPPDLEQQVAKTLFGGGPSTSRIRMSADRLVIEGGDFWPDNICTR